MALGVVTNVSSLSAQRSLAETSRVMESAMEKLSSGKRINSAADDASGLATANRMEAQIRGLNQAVRNANDGQAMVQTLESAMEEVEDILQRLRTLAVQSASDTSSGSDRTYLNDEKTALLAEIDRIASKTEYNGVRVLDGTLAALLQVGAKANDTISLSQTDVSSATLGGFISQEGSQKSIAADTAAVGSTTTTSEDITIAGHLGTGATEAAAGDDAKETARKVNLLTATTGVSATARTAALITAISGTQTGLDLTIQAVGGTAASTGAVNFNTGGFDAVVKAINGISGTTGVTATRVNDGILLEDADGDDILLSRNDTIDSDVTIKQLEADNTTTVGTAITLQETDGATGTTTDHARITGMVDFHSAKTFTITAAGTPTNGFAVTGAVTSTAISGLDLSTRTGANTAITLLDGAIETIAGHRANLGAIDNRLEHTVSNLMSVSEATSSAKSRIEDADFAVESANLSKAQVLMQAGTAMLAQANASPQLVLQLLQ